MQQVTSPDIDPGPITGILLAAGRGSRFDPAGMRDKLLQPLPNGEPVAVAAARNLLAALPKVLAVVRQDAHTLAAQLQEIGCDIAVCANADEGMAASLVEGVSRTRDAAGWVIALADMPYVQPTTMRALVEALQGGAQIAAPTYLGKRGNPVAFSRTHLTNLLSLHGDEGARRLLMAFPFVAIATDDPGIAQDIDIPEDILAKQAP